MLSDVDGRQGFRTILYKAETAAIRLSTSSPDRCLPRAKLGAEWITTTMAKSQAKNERSRSKTSKSKNRLPACRELYPFSTSTL